MKNTLKVTRFVFSSILLACVLVSGVSAQGTWTTQTSAADNSWTSIAWGGPTGQERFVAVASSGSGNRVMTSPDGISWTSRTSAADNSWTSVVWGGPAGQERFVAVSVTGTGNRVMTSPDGITWTSRTSAANNSWTSVTYGNGIFVAVSNSGTGNRVMTSPDGITWTSRTSAADNSWTSVVWGGPAGQERFVAVSSSGSGNRVMTSPDGISWTIRTSAANNNWTSVTYGNGIFVAVSNSGTGNRVMTSPDGITWTSRTSAADNSWNSITYGNGLFVAVSSSGTGNRVMTSPDGITWTSKTAATDNDWYGIVWGEPSDQKKFVAVSSGTGTGNRVMTYSPANTLLITPFGETGTSGTNWSIATSNNVSTLTVIGTASIQASVLESVLASGPLLVIGNSNNSNNFQVTVNQPISVNSGSGDLTFGSSTNTGTMTLSAPMTLSGNLSIYGGSILINGPLSVAGNVLLDGDTGSFLTQNTKGVTVTGPITTSNNGNITILGRGGSGTTYSQTHGVDITQSIQAGGTGTISITGIGGLANNGLNGSNHGINMTGFAAWVKSNGGNVSLTGTGGGAGTGTYSQGVAMVGARASAGGSGTLTILGTGGVNTAVGLRGVVLVNQNTTPSSVFTAGGTISITGNPGANGSDNSDGITIVDSNIGSATSGAITLTGAAGGGTGSEAIAVSGTNVLGATGYAGNIVFRGNNFSTANTTTFTTTGTLTIESLANSFSSSFLFPSEFALGSGVSGLTVGKNTNTSNITLGSALSTAGPVTVYGGNVSINESIITSSNAGHILVKASGNIRLLGEKTLSTQGANVVLWANSDGGATLGDIALQSNFSGSTGARVQTNGGHIWLGGGSGSTTWNGITVGDGYAVSGSAISFLNDPANGSLPSGVLFQGAKLLSGGGNIYVGGKSQQANSRAVVTTGPVEINSGSGTTEIQAIATTTAGALGTGWNHVSSVPAMNGNFTITSSNATSSAILLNADATASNVANGDFQDEGSGLAGVVSLRTTNGGGLVFNSLGSSARAAAYGLRLGYSTSQGGTLELLSNAGNITLNTGDRRIFLSNNLTNTTLGFKDATPVTASTSQLKLITNDLSASGALNFNTSGQLIIEPFGSSFTSTVNTGQLLYSAGITGLTIGKLGNTSGITIGSSTSIAGPMTVYGGDITVDGNINTSAGNANGDVFLKATGSITQNSSRAITTAGGDVVFWADTDANQGGDIFFGATSTYTSPASIQTGGGHIWLGGGSGSTTWNGLTVGDGYAVGASNRTVGGSFTHTNGITIQATILNSGGGDIYLKGKGKAGDSPSAYSGGIYLLGAGAMNSGGGNITIEAFSNTGSGNKYGLYNLGGYTFAPGAGDLSITGDASASSATSGSSVTGRGIFFWTSMSPIVSSGNISLTGVKSSANDTHGIDIRTAITTTGGNLSLSAESLSLASSLSASGTLTLTTTSPLTYNQALTANLLNLLGNGASYTLTNVSNNATRLTANTGAINYVDANALTLGQITATGEVQIATQTGSLTLDGNITTSSTTTNAITLNAGKSAAIGTSTGGNLIVIGTPTVTTGTGGIVKLFSGSDGESTGLISLVGGVGNTRLGVDESTTTFNPTLSSGGRYALFRALSNSPLITNLAGDAVSFVFQSNPVPLDANSNAQVTDSDSQDFNGGVLTVSFASNTGIAAEDRLGISNQGTGAGQIGISGSNVLFQGVTLGTFTGGTTGANLVITLNATATPTSVAALLRALNYSNSNTTLSIESGNRQVAITLTDGDGGTSVVATVTVSIITTRTLSIESGNNQTGPVNQPLSAGLVLKVLASDGSPAANASLTLTASTGQFSLPVLSNLSNSYSTGGSEITNNSWKAHLFTTGNGSISLNEVALVLNSKNLQLYPYPTTVQLEVAIYTVVNGFPTTVIGTSGIQSALLPGSATWKTLAFSNPIELSPNTSYALVVKSDSPIGFKWGNVRPSLIDPSGFATYLNAAVYTNSNWISTVVNQQYNTSEPVSTTNAFILKGSTPLSNSQTLVTNANGMVGLGSWVLGDRAGTQQLLVTNGNLLGSPLTITATATAVVPSAPTNLSYSPGNGQVTLAFTPGYDGGSVVTNYEYSLDNGTTWTALSPADTSSPVTITGLANGTTYPVKIRAVNTAGQGAASASISVNSVIPLTNQSITVDPIANQTYTGSALTPAVVVKDGSTTLTLTTDYTVAYTNNTNVGTATVTITGAGNYSGTKTQTFTIAAKAASTLTIDAIANQTYTGSALTPAVVVKDGNTTLTLGTDYTVVYTNNTNVGTATVTITGAGNYSGTKTQIFTIAAKAASTLTIDAIANQTYTGAALTPAVVVKDGNTTLTLGTDYTVVYTNNTNVGTATVTITGADNYSGTKTQTFTIVAKAASTLTIDAIANQTYTGSALTPAVVVKDGNTTLTTTTDYTVAYTNNTNAGTATVTITGVGSYSGTKSQTFVVQPKALTIRAVNATKIYGDANPILRFTYSGLVDGDTEIDQVPSISTTATTASGVGTYRIILTGGSDPNYTLTRVEGVLEVTPASLSLTVNGATKIYGQADPVYTYSIQGLKGADTEVVLRGALTREAGEDPGTYRISAGTLSAGVNYTLSVSGANLQILKARALSVAELGLITTVWSKEAALPATVNVLATHGQYYRVEVKWDKSKLNLLARGIYSLDGTLILPSGIENPDQILAKVQVQVLPKAAPLDVTLDNSNFVGSTSTYFIPIGAFVVNDPVDKIHALSLNGPGYDNRYFVILNNILYWNSADLAAGKTKFSILVRVTDRDGNMLDKFFEITRSRPSISDIIIYNSFSPNGDRFNDTWGIEEARFYSGSKLQVFDRGGVRVFYTEDPRQRWDGTYSGKELATGTYYWTLEVAETGQTRRGVLNVMRK